MLLQQSLLIHARFQVIVVVLHSMTQGSALAWHFRYILWHASCFQSKSSQSSQQEAYPLLLFAKSVVLLLVFSLSLFFIFLRRFFQVYRSEEAENIGYVIPTTVVSHFLNDYERNGKYTGRTPSLLTYIHTVNVAYFCAECSYILTVFVNQTLASIKVFLKVSSI